MITYNLFRERRFKIDGEEVWMTPFQLAGAKYTDAQEAWDILKNFFSEIYSNFKPAKQGINLNTAVIYIEMCGMWGWSQILSSLSKGLSIYHV